jgi:hypothetical protein
MRFDHHQTVSCHIGDNDSNMQDFGDQFNVTGLLIGRNELDELEVLVKADGICGNFGIDKLLLFIKIILI